MITPEFWDYELDILQTNMALQESILRDIVRRLSKTDMAVTDTAAWQAEKIQGAGKVYDSLIQEIAQAANSTEQEIRRIFADAETQIFDYDSDILIQAGHKTAELKRLSPAMKQIWAAALKKTCTEAENLTKTTAITAQSLYIQACDLAHMQIASGAFSYQDAIKNGIKSAARQGVTVVYDSGWVSGLDTAIRRSALTSVNQTAGQLQLMRAEELDHDIMEITAHMGARPDHADWQGKLVSLSGKTGYLSLADIGYGDVRGFMGANCRHNWYMFWPGVSVPAYSPEQLEEFKNAKVSYNDGEIPIADAIQKQRGMERAVRATKRELVMLDEAMKNGRDMQTEFNRASVKLKQQEARIKDFCTQTGLKRDRFREQMFAADTENGIRNFGRSVSGKAVQANKKAVDFGGGRGIIKVQGGKIMNINNIDSPIEQRNTAKGNPNAIIQFNRPLNNRQQKLLERLSAYDSKTIVRKDEVNMKDLSALTAITGDEFALFTKGKERLVVRGNAVSVNIDIAKAQELSQQGYKWSGHTHPGVGGNSLISSRGDQAILAAFRQEKSVIYNSKGMHEVFYEE